MSFNCNTTLLSQGNIQILHANIARLGSGQYMWEEITFMVTTKYHAKNAAMMSHMSLMNILYIAMCMFTLIRAQLNIYESVIHLQLVSLPT